MMLVVLGLAGSWAGCGASRGKGRISGESLVDDMRRGRRPMGQVVLVEARDGFVLVRTPLAASTSAERELVVKAQGSATTTGRLKVTPERKRNMVAADIVEGEPKVGDVVFYLTNERVVSMAPPAAEPGTAAGRPVGGAGFGGAGFGEGLEPDGSAYGEGASGGWQEGDLPPLGEPSGPRELVPDFPGLEPLPEGGLDEFSPDHEAPDAW